MHSDPWLTQGGRGPQRFCSIGYALTDTLDDLISENRIDPQLAMKILANFDRAIAETLQDKVKSRLTFKVNSPSHACMGNLHPPRIRSDLSPPSEVRSCSRDARGESR